jgi:hypothetical protein
MRSLIWMNEQSDGYRDRCFRGLFVSCRHKKVTAAARTIAIIQNSLSIVRIIAPAIRFSRAQ